MMANMDKHRDENPLLGDPALAEALAATAALGRLSNEDVRTMRAARRRSLATAGAVVLVAMAGAGGWWRLQLSAPQEIVQHFETRRGELRDVRLADGTTLRLNGATRLDVVIATDHRVVRLADGEAYFDVPHDAARPFTVHAGAVDARVLGTAFDIDMTRSQVGLSVYRGAVRFSPSTRDRGVVVKGGWRTRYRNGTTDAPSPFDTGQLDWRQGWLDTSGMKLADLVETLNRQGSLNVSPPPAPLAGMAVSGRFRLDDPQQLLTAIGSAYGFTVVRHGDSLNLSSTPS